MGFALFLLVNVMLFLRPEELVPEVGGFYLYQNSILACMLFSLTAVSQLLFSSPLRRHPTFICVVLLLPFALFSLLLNRDGEQAFAEFKALFAVFVYFFLFLALVTTPARLRAVTAVILLCSMVTAIVGILHFHGVIDMPALQILEGVESVDGTIQHRRLRFTGMLNDPNEVAVLLSVFVFLGAYQWRSLSYGFFRHLWLVPLGIFLAAIALTQSRGGLLALFAGIAAYAIYRFQGTPAPGALPGRFAPGGAPARRGGGAWKAVAFLMVAFPLMLVMFGGRQTEFRLQGSTGQGRIGLWYDWMQEFRASPLWGVSPAVVPPPPGENRQHVNVSHLAHNSYLQAFADLGFFGGACFLGACLFGIATLHRYAFGKTSILDPDQQRLHPHLIAAVAAYLVGMLTLSINYLVTTAFVLALPLAFYGMTRCYPPVAAPRLDFPGLVRLSLRSVGFLVFTFIIARYFSGY